MRFSLRIFLGYFLLVALLAVLLLKLVGDEIKPAVRQSTEEVLIDTANLLAEAVQADFVAGQLNESRFAAALQAFAARDPEANVWGVKRDRTFLRVTITDAKGLVLLDSSGQDVGADYSQWRDVYRTLRGQYGARSTRADPNDELSTVMHVAAPIRDGNKIVGVLTVARPNWAMQPYIERSEGKLWRAGALLLAVGLLLGAGFSWWLSRGITKLTDFAHDVGAGKPVAVPHFVANRELTTLAQALGEMREKLEGKAYVENYVHALTHELKSPLAGIRASAELLDEDLDADDHARFVGHIRAETARMQQIVDYLLQLATLEARRSLHEPQALALGELVDGVLLALAPQSGHCVIEHAPWPDDQVMGERFLLEQAIRNLLQNALDFTPAGGDIRIGITRQGNALQLTIFNEGESIPDYALPRLFERFYSLPRPGTGQKSTGLGLALTRAITELHGGSVWLANSEGGVSAHLRLPLSIA
ncbi:two-component system sensor histidine kinase CreC [Chitinilyticum aquatile]|uniref:two-component system sensor histidine kinase CreC n=1 Tax=Chitinilyticum aquatile TaxID=362520 RepID=UPI000402EBEC|nr:two-component system sensor histidine kinase CreC [Chitinilyticum aquatile]